MYTEHRKLAYFSYLVCKKYLAKMCAINNSQGKNTQQHSSNNSVTIILSMPVNIFLHLLQNNTSSRNQRNPLFKKVPTTDQLALLPVTGKHSRQKCVVLQLIYYYKPFTTFVIRNFPYYILWCTALETSNLTLTISIMFELHNLCL